RELEHDASRHRTRRQACLVRVNRPGPVAASSGDASGQTRTFGDGCSMSALPRKRTYLPILELLPPPTLRERRRRGLARRLPRLWVGVRSRVLVSVGGLSAPKAARR